MNLEQFLLLQPEQKIYNKTLNQFAIVSSGTGLKNQEDISKAVTERLEGKETRYSIQCRNLSYVGMSIYDATNHHYRATITTDDHDDWAVINSVIEIPDQRLINVLLMIEINNIKEALLKPQNVPQYQPPMPPPLKTEGVYVDNSLNLF